MSKWEWKKLGDLYPIVMGKTPPRGDSSYWDKEKKTNNIWVSIADISANENSIIRDSKEYISNKAAKNIKLVAPDSLLVSFKLTIGKMAFAGVPLYTNEAIISLPPRKDISLEYLHKYFLYFDWDKACSGDVKVKGKTLNKEKLKNIDVLLPPLSEQKRIVKFLDEEFSKIDTLKTNAETNLKNAKELFESTLEKELNPQSRHSERSEESSADLPSGWEWKKIGDFCETSSGGTPLKQHNEYYENGNIPWLRSGEVCQKEIFETEMYITQKGMDNSSAKFFPENSVVVAMYGATAGQVGIVRFRTTTNQAVCGIFPNEKYKTEYLYYALLSKKNELVAQAVGGAQPNISQIKIRNLQIPLPPLSVQKEIVARLDKLSENVKRLEANYKQIIADCDELKKSILKKTFEEES